MDKPAPDTANQIRYTVSDNSGGTLYQLTEHSTAQKPGRLQRMGKMLNSSLFIWVLSTLLVGGLTQLYTYNKEQAAIERNIKTLDLEIESRLSQFLIALEPLVAIEGDTSYRFIDDSAEHQFILLWDELKLPPKQGKWLYTTFAEFNDVSLASLIMRQSQTLPSLGRDVNEAKENGYENWPEFETKDLGDEIKRIRNAGKWLLTNRVNAFNHDGHIDIKKMLEEIYRNVILQRWKWTYPYVDCNPGFPFC